MSESPRHFDLGIIGGCMSHQRDIPLNALYHRELAGLIRTELGVRLRPRIVRGFELDYRDRLDRLLAGPPVDGVMVHLRVTIIARSRLIRRETIDGRTRYSMHPALLRRGHQERAASPRGPSDGGRRAGPEGPWESDAYPRAEVNAQDRPPPGRRIAGFRVRDLNYALGALAGLDRWAIDEELLRFGDLERACRERGVSLFVLGPTPVANSYWQNRVVRKVNVEIRHRMAALGLSYSLIEQLRDSAGRPLTRDDGIHLTVDGHRFVAEQLYRHGLGEWGLRILAAHG